MNKIVYQYDIKCENRQGEIERTTIFTTKALSIADIILTIFGSNYVFVKNLSIVRKVA